MGNRERKYENRHKSFLLQFLTSGGLLKRTVIKFSAIEKKNVYPKAINFL